MSISSGLLRLRLSKMWAKSVYGRDRWICQKCGKHCDKGDIVAHHRETFEDYPELRFDINNGITLCRGCHLGEHNAH